MTRWAVTYACLFVLLVVAHDPVSPMPGWFALTAAAVAGAAACVTGWLALTEHAARRRAAIESRVGYRRTPRKDTYR